MTSNASLVGAAMVLVVLLAAYGYLVFASPEGATQQVRIANPAATNCIDLGGSVEIREGVGGDAGFCVFPDGRICEEWELFRTGACVNTQ